MRTRLKRSTDLSRLLLAVVFSFSTAWFHGVALADGSSPPDRQPELPSPLEIRDYEPMNHMMVVEYANGRKFLFRVIKVTPRFECNQVKIDPIKRTIIIITQAPSNAYEYQLEQFPIMTSDWVAWDGP